MVSEYCSVYAAIGIVAIHKFLDINFIIIVEKGKPTLQYTIINHDIILSLNTVLFFLICSVTAMEMEDTFLVT